MADSTYGQHFFTTKGEELLETHVDGQPLLIGPTKLVNLRVWFHMAAARVQATTG